jgi:hypothetical protein
MLILLHAGVTGHMHIADTIFYGALIVAGATSIWLQWRAQP